MVFERKKIQAETLSEYLREIRTALHLTPEQAAERVGIKLRFLQALESGEFKQLPPDVYVMGFLRQLAELYAADGALLVEQYKKEKIIVNQMSQRPWRGPQWATGRLRQLVITPKVISIGVGTAFVLITVAYIIWQVAAINKTPALELYQPKDRELIAGSVVVVRGKTDPDMNVTVNGQTVFVDSNGNFQTQLGIEAGPKQLAIVASNKFDKTTTKQISVIGQPNLVASSTSVSLKLEFSGDVSLAYAVDDNPSQTLSFHNGDIKVLTGLNKIVISTTDAGATVVTANGQRLGALGRKGEQLANIPFYPLNPAVNTIGP